MKHSLFSSYLWPAPSAQAAPVSQLGWMVPSYFLFPYPICCDQSRDPSFLQPNPCCHSLYYMLIISAGFSMLSHYLSYVSTHISTYSVYNVLSIYCSLIKGKLCKFYSNFKKVRPVLLLFYPSFPFMYSFQKKMCLIIWENCTYDFSDFLCSRIFSFFLT